jgi:serine/threonine protein phosphatase PrpC
MDLTTLQEPRIYSGGRMAAPEHWRITGGSVSIYSHRAPDKETENEDVAALIPLGEKGALLLVADGMGGARAGGQAAEIAVRTLIHALRHPLEEEASARIAILNGFEAANHAVMALGAGAATTLAIVEFRRNRVRAYHVGDSAILMLGQRRRVKFQTVSHSPVGFAVEAGLLDEEDALHHEERHLVSNMLGAEDMRIEIGSERHIARRDTLVLGSDGLFDNLSVDEIAARVCTGPLPRAAERLTADCWRRMIDPAPGEPSKTDDLSFILLRRGSEPPHGGD